MADNCVQRTRTRRASKTSASKTSCVLGGAAAPAKRDRRSERRLKPYRFFNLLLQFLTRVWCIIILLVLVFDLTPAIAQSQTFAPVLVDGRQIFQVSSYESLTAQVRADWINFQLQAIVESGEPPQIAIEQRNQSPIVLLNDRYLMTVTQSDLALDLPPEEQAQIWAEQIRQAVQRAQQERSSEFLWQSLLLVAGIVILAIALHWGLGWLWRQSLGETTKLLTSERATADYQLHTLNLSLKLRLLLARITLWLTVLIYAINLFPLTRQWSYRLSNGLIVDLTFPLLFILFSLIAGQCTPFLIHWFISQLFPQKGKDIYQNLVEPNTNLLIIASTLIFISFCLVWIREYEVVYSFFRFFVDLGTIASLAWLSSRLFRRLVRVYGIDLINKLGREVDELLLVFETLANVIIGFIAIVAFAQSRFDLVGLLAGLGIGGLAIAFAAQKTLEQLLGTVVLYLDRPFVPGEYIRLPSSQQLPEELFGRVESIGLRSTKIRTLAKSTLMIVPNSLLANLEIENVSRGKKVMVLLYLDFAKLLAKREQALVEQVVKESTDTLFGIDPGSTKISLFQSEDKPGTRARVSFFILGSSQDSIALRKRLLELANEKISKKLTDRGIEFTMQEPTVYVESPMTI